MAIKTFISSPKNDLIADIDNGDEKNALVVATRPLKELGPAPIPFLNSTFGVEMAQNAAFGGTPDKVHDGLDTTLYTGSNVSGNKVSFDSTDQANNGTKSVKVNKPGLGDVWQFDKGSDLTLSSFTAITMFVYIDNNWGADDSVEVFGFDTGTGLQVGTSVMLEEFFDETTFGTWHKLAIPLTDMNLTTGTIDALRMEYTVKDGVAPLFYIDDIQFEQTGNPIKYTVAPPKGFWLRFHTIDITIVDALAGTVTDGTMPALAYNKILNEPALATGFVSAVKIGGLSITTFAVKTLQDFVTVPGQDLISAVSDGTNTMIKIRGSFPSPILFKSEDGDEASITISDDLTGLISVKMGATVTLEDRSLVNK